MADHLPFAAVGPREPQKRPRPVPMNVRVAIGLMIWGHENDEESRPLDMIEAARAAGMKPNVLRKYFDRPAVRSLIRAQRKVFREAIGCANEAALRRVRDKSANGMCTVAAVRALEQLEAEATARAPSGEAPGITIRIVQRRNPASPIDVTPAPRTIEHDDAACAYGPTDSIFRPAR